MKKLLPLFLLLSAFTVASLQDDVEKEVTAHIKRNAVHADSYESVKFRKAEKFMTNYYMTDSGQAYVALFSETGRKAKESKEAGRLEEMNQHVEEGKRLMNILMNKFITYKPTQYGWKIIHQYRLADSPGEVRQRQDTFYLNQQLQVVNKDTIRLQN